MSRENTPTDNAVAERFMRTFKEHLINGKTFEQATQESIISGSKSYKSILNIYIQSLNTRPNRKTLFKSPYRHDSDVLTASLSTLKHFTLEVLLRGDNEANTGL